VKRSRETAITDTATSPPKPKNSAFNSGYAAISA
jgi:hypothetical protein